MGEELRAGHLVRPEVPRAALQARSSPGLPAERAPCRALFPSQSPALAGLRPPGSIRARAPLGGPAANRAQEGFLAHSVQTPEGRRRAARQRWGSGSSRREQPRPEGGSHCGRSARG